MKIENIVLWSEYLNNLYVNIKIKYKVILMKIILILLYLPYTLCVKLKTYQWKGFDFANTN